MSQVNAKRPKGRPRCSANPQEVIDLRARGRSWLQIARELGIGRTTARKLYERQAAGNAATHPNQKQFTGEIMNGAEHTKPPAEDARQVDNPGTPAADAPAAPVEATAPLESPFITSKEIARQHGEMLRRQFGERLSRIEALRVATEFKTALVPKRKGGRPPSDRITRAFEDWKAGMRGVTLFAKHIPGWHKHNRYRRMGEQKALTDAIRNRWRRESAKER